MEKRKKITKQTGPRKSGRPPLSDEEKFAKGLHFGVSETQFKEFLAIKQKLGIRSLAEAARKLFLQGLQRVQEDEGSSSRT